MCVLCVLFYRDSCKLLSEDNTEEIRIKNSQFKVFLFTLVPKFWALCCPQLYTEAYA